MSSFFSDNKNAAGQDGPAPGLKLFTAAGILLSGLLMAYAARGDLWLDEIWSIFFAEAATTPWEILSVYKHDNNHILNTLYLYFVGKQSHLTAYRALSILSGILTLVVMVNIAGKWGRLESIVILLFAGISYPLTIYFSEARGYATAMLFAVLALYILQEYQNRPNLLNLVMFWIVTLLGILSHLSFIIIVVALSLYIIYYEMGLKHAVHVKILNISKLLAVPFALIIIFYIYFAKNMMVGGGDVNNILAETANGLACLTGLPDSLVYLGFPIAIAIITFGVYSLIRQKDALWVFYLSVTLITPLLLLLATRPTIYYFRYLVVCFPFYYLLATYAFGKAYRSNKGIKIILIAIMLMYSIGQSQRILPFIEFGRGNYNKVLTEISRRTQGDIITIGSDHDFRNKMLVSFYSRFIQPPKKISYIDRKDWNAAPPEWIITHSADPYYEAPSWITILDKQQYKLIRTEKYYRNSGFSWFLYHKEDS